MKQIKKAFFHIGNGKTGTSAIQKSLYQNFDKNLEKKVFFLGMHFEKLWQKIDNKKLEELKSLSNNKLNNKKIKQDIINKIEKANIENFEILIFSNEAFFKYSDNLKFIIDYLL